MKAVYNKDARLESHRFFPYIAWGLVILFAFFVYDLTTGVSDKASSLKEKNQQTNEEYTVPISELRKQNTQ